MAEGPESEGSLVPAEFHGGKLSATDITDKGRAMY